MTSGSLYAGSVPLVVLLLLLPMALLALMPLVLWQRYRVGTSRRLARAWVATVSLVLMVISAVLFLFGAAVTTIWVSGALAGAAAGIGVGAMLGVLGLLLTRWESGIRELHYTPNRWLVLLVTLIVSARILYGVVRAMWAAQAGLGGTSVIDAFGIPGSLGAGGTVIGYYLTYAMGVRWQIRRWERRPLRTM
jgi:hypothetical protein